MRMLVSIVPADQIHALVKPTGPVKKTQLSKLATFCFRSADFKIKWLETKLFCGCNGDEPEALFLGGTGDEVGFCSVSCQGTSGRFNSIRCTLACHTSLRTGPNYHHFGTRVSSPGGRYDVLSNASQREVCKGFNI